MFGLLFVLTACGAVPQSGIAPRPAQSQTTLPSHSAGAIGTRSTSARLCISDLGQAGARFSALPDRHLAPGCHQLGTVQLDRLSGDDGSIAITNIGPLACPIAQTFAGWTRFGVDRAARQHLGSGLARIETMGSYSCRNVAGTTRLSAHSRSEAIDVAAFVLEDGRRISVKHDWDDGTNAERRFLRIVHQSACKRFGTVLGPDYNTAHHDHFHFERSLQEGQGPAYCK
ncbi:extensin family protein [Altererythrobacter sp. MF3-039]|uniref:extensin-like domain-containing protein n=1 Tax=Altererythrobacter sp. MF3-039 TaxID=3252901 RepID=UPI00390C8C69